jgi:hypothetical protein
LLFYSKNFLSLVNTFACLSLQSAIFININMVQLINRSTPYKILRVDSVLHRVKGIHLKCYFVFLDNIMLNFSINTCIRVSLV